MRLAVSRKTDLALRVLRTLAADGHRSHTAAFLAGAVGATSGYLPHVMAPLVRAGWVRSTPGPHGGYRLAAGGREVSLLELIEAVEGRLDSGRCVIMGTTCSAEEPCPLHEHWTRAKRAMQVELSRIQVCDGLAPPARP